MKNVSLVFLFCFVLFIGGCSQQTGKELKNESTLTEISVRDESSSFQGESIPTVTPTEEIVETTQEEMVKEAFTMDQVKIFSEKEMVTIQELKNWKGLQECSLPVLGFRQYYYDFFYEDREYRLEFRSGEDDEVLFVRLVDMQTMLSIDIRTGNIEHLVDNLVSMDDYLSLTLPEGISTGQYDLYMGHFGGARLNNVNLQETESCGGIYILDGSRVKPNIIQGELLSVNDYDNNIFHEGMEPLSLSPVPSLLTLMKLEEANGIVTQYYSIYFAEKSCFYCYNIRLRTDLFTKEEALTIAESIQFSERAFNQ